MGASKWAMGGALTQFHSQGPDLVIAHFSRKLSVSEEQSTNNEKDILGLLYCLKRFRCCMEGNTLDAFTDNEILKNVFKETKFVSKEVPLDRAIPTSWDLQDESPDRYSSCFSRCSFTSASCDVCKVRILFCGYFSSQINL